MNRRVAMFGMLVSCGTVLVGGCGEADTTPKIPEAELSKIKTEPTPEKTKRNKAATRPKSGAEE